MSTTISRFKKVFSLQLDRVPIDAVGVALLQRIKDLLAMRSDVTRSQFLAAIGRPTPSWGSEFFNGQRTTNDLRLVMKIARFFGVSVGYLLSEHDRERNTALTTVIGAWPEMDEHSQRAVLNMVLMLKGRAGDPGTAPDRGSSPAPSPGAGTTRAPKKRR